MLYKGREQSLNIQDRRNRPSIRKVQQSYNLSVKPNNKWYDAQHPRDYSINDTLARGAKGTFAEGWFKDVRSYKRASDRSLAPVDADKLKANENAIKALAERFRGRAP